MKPENRKKPLIGIIGGKGRMGNWFDNFFKKIGLEVLISDINTKLSNVDLAKKADIVMVAVPIRKTIEVIEEIRSFVRKDALLCDITSLKIKPIKAMKKSKSGALGMHPLFGPLVSGLEGQTIVFCRVRNNKWTDFLSDIFLKNKAKIVEIPAKEHDKQMAIVQALTHFSNISLARTLYYEKTAFNPSFLTPVFRLQSLILGRILGQSPELYADIEMENPYFPKILADFKKEIQGLSQDITTKNFKNFTKKFKETSQYLDGFRKLAQTKSVEILRIVDRQPIKLKEAKRKIGFRKKSSSVGFLGPEGTFSHQAAKDAFGKNAKFVPLGTIRDVFEAVNNHEVDFGVVPAENSTTGIVSETMYNLINYPLKVTGSFDLKIHQCLLARVEDKKRIKIIESHEQALSQCRNWLQNNLSQVKLKSVSSTILPIIEKKKKETGFIAPKVASEIYNLNILARNIEDNKDNFTKFYLISTDIYKEAQEKLEANRTLVLFAVYDRVGILRDILNVFAKNGLNLTSLHSTPSRLKPWDYFFFVEVEVFFPSAKIKKVLKEIAKYCPIIRVIGVS